LGHDSTPINNFSPSLINFVKCSGEIRYRYLNGQIPDDVLVKYFNCFKEFHFTGNGSYEGFASGDSSTKNVI
jgi:hypothetical protein